MVNGADKARQNLDLMLRLLAVEPGVSRLRIALKCCDGGVSDVVFTIEGSARRLPSSSDHDLTAQVPAALDAILKDIEERRYTGEAALIALCSGRRIYRLKKGFEASV